MSWTRKKSKNQILRMHLYYHFKGYATLYIIGLFFLIAALIGGATTSIKVLTEVQPQFAIANTNYFQTMIRNVMVNCIIIIVLFASGPVYLGCVTAPVAITWLGFEAGYTIMYLICTQKLKGVIFSVIGLAVTNVFLFMLVGYAGAIVSSYSIKKIISVIKGTKKMLPTNRKEYIQQFLVVALCIVAVSALKVLLQQIFSALLYD